MAGHKKSTRGTMIFFASSRRTLLWRFLGGSFLLLLLLPPETWGHEDGQQQPSSSGCNLCATTSDCQHAFPGQPARYCGTFFDPERKAASSCCCPLLSSCKLSANSCQCHVSHRNIMHHDISDHHHSSIAKLFFWLFFFLIFCCPCYSTCCIFYLCCGRIWLQQRKSNNSNDHNFHNSNLSGVVVDYPSTNINNPQHESAADAPEESIPFASAQPIYSDAEDDDNKMEFNHQTIIQSEQDAIPVLQAPPPAYNPEYQAQIF
jgi:hypothetical protein